MTKIIQDLKEKYSLSPDSYYKEGVNPYKVAQSFEDTAAYETFKKKWVPLTQAGGWYGVTGLGYPMPRVWYEVLNDFLEWCKITDPDFKILQMKIKMGSCRIHISTENEEIQDSCWELTSFLSDEKLIY